MLKGNLHKYIDLRIDQIGKKKKVCPLVPLEVSGLCMNFFIAISHISELYSYGKLLELKEELPEC